MSNINVTDHWWTDPRRAALARKLNNSAAHADGCALMLWKIAFQYWSKQKQAVPKQCFDLLEGATQMLEVGLAEVRNDEVYVKGSTEHFDWIHKKREAGKKGGRKRVENALKTQAILKHTSSTPQAPLKQNQPNCNDNSTDNGNYKSNYNTKKEEENTEARAHESMSIPMSSPGQGTESLALVVVSEAPVSKSSKKKKVGFREVYPPEFEKLWDQYSAKLLPARAKKKESHDVFKSLALSGDELDKLSIAISSYLAKNATAQYVKGFERFLKEDWRVYLEGNPGSNELDFKTQENLNVLQSFEARLKAHGIG